MPLETVDLEAVEILSVGGPVRGVGSPPEGDYFTEQQLRDMASAAAELRGEINPPSKIGHSKSSDPAVGWLDNIRVNDDGTKLLADVRNVPKTFSDLIDAGAWRHRSVELRKYTSQKTGKTYDWVVSGLAWLGGQLPAVKTLDDVVKLYEGDTADIRFIALFEEGRVAWNPADGLEALRHRVRAALNPGKDVEDGYWVRDIAPGRALVQEGYDDVAPAWVVPFTVDGDAVTIAARSAWTQAEQAWVETARTFAAAVPDTATGRIETASDSRAVTASKYTDEQRRTFAEATGLDADKVTDEMLSKAGVTEPKADDDSPDKDSARELEELRAKLDETTRTADQARIDAEKANEDLRLERRRNFVEGLITSGRIEPGARETWEKRYDRDPELSREFAEALKPDPALARELGSEGDDERELSEVDAEARELAEKHEIARRYDIPVEQVI